VDTLERPAGAKRIRDVQDAIGARMAEFIGELGELLVG